MGGRERRRLKWGKLMKKRKRVAQAQEAAVSHASERARETAQCADLVGEKGREER